MFEWKKNKWSLSLGLELLLKLFFFFEIQIQLEIHKLILKFPIKLSITDLVVTPNVSIPDHLSTTEQTVYTVKLGIKHSLVYSYEIQVSLKEWYYNIHI